MAALNELDEWIKVNTKKAEAHYLCSQYRIIKWSSEYKLYSIIRFWYNDVVFQFAPEWLNGQSIDIFIPSRKIGIEYQGKQHFSPIDFFGGEDAFEDYVLRDQKKSLLCKENGIELRQWSYENKIRFSDVTFFLNIDYSQVTKRLYEINEFTVKNLLIVENRKERDTREQKRKRPNTLPMNTAFTQDETNDNMNSITSKSAGNSKAVIKIDVITGEMLKRYSSIGAAANDVGINRKGISDVLRGKQRTAGGFMWQFDKENDFESLLAQESQGQVP